MKFWALLALAASVAAIPLQGPAGRVHKRDEARKHIGYRVVSKVRPPGSSHLIYSPVTQLTDISQAEAEAIHKNDGKAVQSTGKGIQQLGLGTYISPKFQLYKDFDPKMGIPWDCVVTADANFWDGLKKAWVPKLFEFPEDKEKNPDQCQPLPLWSPRYRECLSKLPKKSPFFCSFPLSCVYSTQANPSYAY